MKTLIEYIDNGYVGDVAARLTQSIQRIIDKRGGIVAVSMYPCDIDDNDWWAAIITYQVFDDN